MSVDQGSGVRVLEDPLTTPTATASGRSCVTGPGGRSTSSQLAGTATAVAKAVAKAAVADAVAPALTDDQIDQAIDRTRWLPCYQPDHRVVSR
jgi:hypothetical protein